MESHDAEPPEARAAAARDVGSAGEDFSTWHSLTSRRVRRGALGALLVTAAVLAPGAAGTGAGRAGGAPAGLSKTAARMRLKLKAVTQSQDIALSKAEELLRGDTQAEQLAAKEQPAPGGSDDTGANAKAPPEPEFLKEGHGGLDLIQSITHPGARLHRRGARRLDREADRRVARARLGRDEDERQTRRSGPRLHEAAQERRDRSSERRESHLGSEARAMEEAEAFAKLTAGARDPRAAAKKRLAQKHSQESYERASNEGMIWKEIAAMKHHAEHDTLRVDKSQGLSGEVRELADLSPPQAAQVLAKMSQTDGSAALGALKSIDPEQEKRIIDALGEQQHAAQRGPAGGVHASPPAAGKADATGAHGRQQAQDAPQPVPEFNIASVDRFDPGESLSFAGGSTGGTFSMTYADTSVLTGYVCRDIVQLGRYYAMTRFGCAVDCNDPHFDGIDGILGMGLPDAALPNIPTPLFFAISNDRGGIEGANYINERPLHTRKFAFLSDSISGELQLGGYDRASTAADMVYVRATSTTEYSVNVQSLTFGGIELLNWVDKTVPNAIPAIMDTGTTCLVIPDTNIGGQVSDRPYSKFQSIMTKGMSFYITIDGHLFEIPYEFWWQSMTDSPCVQATPASYAGILLGDVVFQSLVVEFDLTKPKRPLIGIAPRNPLYHPVEPGSQDELKIPMIKRHHGKVEIVEPDSHDGSRKYGIDHVPVSINAMRTEYFVNISVGSPRQSFTVLIDTGSSSLAIFAKLAPAHGILSVDDGEVGKRLKKAKEQLLAGGDTAVLAVERGDAREKAHELKRKEHERHERARELQTVGASSFEQRWAGRPREEAMQLALPRSVFGAGSALDLVWARPAQGEARGVGVISAAAGMLMMLSGLFALLRLRRSRRGLAAAC